MARAVARNQHDRAAPGLDQVLAGRRLAELDDEVVEMRDALDQRGDVGLQLARATGEPSFAAR